MDTRASALVSKEIKGSSGTSIHLSQFNRLTNISTTNSIVSSTRHSSSRKQFLISLVPRRVDFSPPKPQLTSIWALARDRNQHNFWGQGYILIGWTKFKGM